jgi:hypothetical protein
MVGCELVCFLATDPADLKILKITIKREHAAACSVLKVVFVVDEPETGLVALIFFIDKDTMTYCASLIVIMLCH